MPLQDTIDDADLEALAGPIGDPTEEDLDVLSEVVLNSFTATPSTIAPFGGGSTLRWNVTVPRASGVQIRLNGVTVTASGSRAVSPGVTTRYTLTAHRRRASLQLGVVTVRVDTSSCITVTVPENGLRDPIRQGVDEIDRAESRFSQRSPARVEVDAAGIHVTLRLVIAIDNFTDPDVNIDCTLGLRIRGGAVEIYLKRFTVDVDWPWWVTVISAGVSKIVEEFIEGTVERRLKPLLVREAQKRIDALVAQLPTNLRLHSLATVQDGIRVTACPAGADTPFLVLPSMEMSTLERGAI